MKRRGFTLVEILVVIAILAVLMTMMIGIFNSIKITNKARDAQRKKDLNRIKVAFEEYFNDNGTYPQDVATWNVKSNCDSSTIFASYLNPWPCDPNGEPYIIVIGNNSFKVLTNLENRKDNSILQYWYDRIDLGINGYTKDQVNYGVSSSNILWYDTIENTVCDTKRCLSSAKGGCNSVSDGCVGAYCYYYDSTKAGSCTKTCKAVCCGAGCD